MPKDNKLITKAKEYLKIAKVDIVIGYSTGSNPNIRQPAFIESAEQANNLILDRLCDYNLALYLVKKNLLAKHKKIAIFLNPSGIRTINILASEQQIDVNKIIILAFQITDNDIKTLQGETIDDFSELLDNLKNTPMPQEYANELAEIQNLSQAKRFEYWQQQFAKCIKCYACRQACPMCYCDRCIVDCNQPQWICPSAHTLGNFEWNIVRAFHLAGRCAECGNCQRACPVEIPLMKINRSIAQEVRERFDYFAGLNQNQQAVLASFKNDDSQEFIL